jgi:hypothetical protein
LGQTVTLERDSISRSVTGIHVDLVARSVALDVEGEDEARVIVDHGALMEPDAQAETPETAQTADGIETPAPPETEAAVVLTGHLRAVPREGRPDRNGKPTAWAPFLGKTETEEKPRAYAATFYRSAAPIALSLGKGADLTVRGFVRPSNDPEKNDWLSVVGVLNYPGKPGRPEPTEEGSGAP